MTKSRLLLIWPPFLNSNVLPLSIPSLVAYLKERKVESVEVFDMNIAYWKTMKRYWFLYMLLKRGEGILKKNEHIFSSTRGFMRDKIFAVLEEMDLEVKKTLPWSLKSIFASLGQDSWLSEKKRIRSLMKPIINKKDFEFIGISINYPDQLFFALLIAAELKEKWGKQIHIIVGGAQVTKNINYLVKSEEVYRLIDFFIVEDGEEPLFKLLTEFPERNFSDIPNLYFKDPKKEGAYLYSGNHFCLTPDNFLIPDFSNFDRDAYQDALSLIASKGCSWGQCTFCDYMGGYDKKFYCGSAEKIITLIKGMEKKYGISEFSFMDSGLQSGFMEILAKELIRNDMKISWTTNIMLDRGFADPDFCNLLTKSGLKWVSFGLESISNRVLKLMNKYHQNLNPEEIRKIITVIRNEGIKIGIFAFFGFPTETFEEARQTLDFVLSNINLLDSVVLYSFFLDDFMLIFREPEKFGITKIYKDDKIKHRGRRLTYCFETKEGMSQEEANKFTNEALVVLRQAFRRKIRMETIKTS